MARIMVVDDDAAVRSIIETMLRSAAATGNVEVSVTMAEDGEACLAAFAEASPDIVIIDLLMPRLDGFQTCKALRNRSDAQKLELCVISGIYRDAAVVKRVQSEFGARFFGKPEGLAELAAHVGQIAEQLARTAKASRASAASLLEPSGEVAADRDPGARSLAAVLLELHETVATGRLTLRRSGVVKTLDVAEGWIVGATSSTREETLGNFLLTSGRITAEQHKRAVARAVERGEKLGQSLIASGVINQTQLSELLVAQLRHKVIATLRWPPGMSRFQRVPVVTASDVRLPMTQIVLAGLRETATPDSIEEALSQLAGSAVIELNDRGRRMMDDLRGLFGARVTDDLAAGGALEALVSRSADGAALRAAIDVLFRCDALAIRQAAVSRPHEVSSGEVADELDCFESGVIEIGRVLENGVRARERLIVEHQRIQGLDPYGVLMIEHTATAREVAAAHAALCGRFERDRDAGLIAPRDLAKLTELVTAYGEAQAMLLDRSRRAALDRQVQAPRPANPPSFRAELAFQDAERLLASGELVAAIACLRAAIDAAPMEPDYHATLGWVLWCLGRTAEAADEARPHLQRALAIHPDHAVAHESIGRIDAALGTDDVQALFHLERALLIDPARREAMIAAREVLLRVGDVWGVVRLHRRFAESMRGKREREVAAWLELADVIRTRVDDTAGEREAIEHARLVAPNDPAVIAALAVYERRHVGAMQTLEPWSASVADWTSNLDRHDLGVELWRSAIEHQQGDAAYLIASALVALGHADAEIEASYQRWRPRFVVRARRDLSQDDWAQIRHPHDATEIGALMALIEPVVHAMTLTTLGDLGVRETMRVADRDLPDSFRKLRSYLAGLLGTNEPAVYVQPELGSSLHIGALAEPVLLAGRDALDSPDRLTLAFRLARAMSFVGPARAIGGSRPARVLRGATLAVVSELAPEAARNIEAADRDGWVSRARKTLDVLADSARARARELAMPLVQRASQLNLSQWARGLSRTADRIGLLVIGDLPLARRLAIGSGAGDDDLVEFAISAAHLRLRTGLGLSIDV